MITDFKQLVDRLQGEEKRRVVAIEAHDEHSQEALQTMLDKGIIDCCLVGDVDKLEPYKEKLTGYGERIKLIDCKTPEEAAAEAIKIAHSGEADVVMKGLVNTDVVLRAILNKEYGILPKGGTLSHIAAFKIPTYNKILFMSDAAVIPYPTLQQRAELIKRAADHARSYGVKKPRIALIHCTEKISEKFPVTLDYKELMDMAGRGELGDIILYGPIDVKCAIDKEAADIKGINSPLEGQADAIIMSDIQAGNVFYKTLTSFTETDLAVGLVGAQCPVVVTSRGDSASVKLNSLAMACISAKK